MVQINKILIANRGEITCRIIRTCKKLGITSVAVYSDPDNDAKFVRESDQALALGGTTSVESYLDIQKILKAAKDSGANAIHPGYGFLSENAQFSKAVSEAGLIFIGPSPETVTKMGSKVESKNIMKKAGVPVIPGYQGANQDTDHLIKEAEKVGLPCMIKASAGGGGKGLKRVNKKSEIKEAIAAAKREGKASFGDDTLLIEKYIESPRHIEIQIFGDQKGNVIHLFERECSLQRRHQKVIEEAPSASISDDTRKKMGQAAIKAAKAVQYVGAGTVEFVVDKDENFYFLEMNTRLQVEHPVTEFITGLDLVEWQILVAQGQALPLKQKDLSISGHAMEARVYAEDAHHQFLPMSGKIAHLKLANIPDVRYDFGVDEGDEINVYYDPMIGKIIAHDTTREKCIQKLSLALQDTTILGTTTNLWFLNNLINHPKHKKGDFDTGFIDQNIDEIIAQITVDKNPYFIAATICSLLNTQKSSSLPLLSNLTGFRISPNQYITQSFLHQNKPCQIKYRTLDAQKKNYEFLIDETKYDVKALHLKDNDLSLSINNQHQEFTFSQSQQCYHFKSAIGNIVIDYGASIQQSHKSDQSGNLAAPLPGKVLKVMVKPKQEVNAGEILMIVEAMKMEHPIKANFDGKINAVHYRENDTVKLGDVLLEMASN